MMTTTRVLLSFLHRGAGCVHQPVICDDGSKCTTDACDPATGACMYGTVSCDDHNVCTIDSCTAAAGCRHDPVSCDTGVNVLLIPATPTAAVRTGASPVMTTTGVP